MADVDADPRQPGDAHRHRHVRCRPLDRRRRARGPRLVRRRQPAAADAQAAGRSRAEGRRHPAEDRGRGRRPRGTALRGRAARDRRAARHGHAPGRVPRRDRRRARAPLRAGAAAASAPGRRHAARRHRRGAHCAWTRSASPATSSSTPPISTSTSSRPRSPSGSPRRTPPACSVTLLSFGFKYGLPPDADIVADCRFLPNPFWIPELRDSHRDGWAGARVRARPAGRRRVHRRATRRRMRPVFAGYQRENKRHATIAIGCTGGKHRSVAIAEELAGRLRGLPGVAVNVKHRDLGRE